MNTAVLEVKSPEYKSTVNIQLETILNFEFYNKLP